MRFTPWLRRHPLDAIVVVLALVQQVEVWFTVVPGDRRIVILATLLWTLPLLLRRRFGFAAPVFAFALRSWGRRAAELERRADRLLSEREERALAAVVAERTRIAHDLQDVIANSLSVMTARARTARLLLDDHPERAREPILALEEAGRQTLADLRRLLGVLHERPGAPTLAPQPGMGGLDALIRRAQVAGLGVVLTVEGEPETLAPGIDLAAYCIVQEALTHALEHAGPARGHGRRALGTRGPRPRGDRRRPRCRRRAQRPRRSARARDDVRGRARGRPACRWRLRRARAAAARAEPDVIRILIADDQALVRGGFRLILDAQHDLEVVGEAGDGREAARASCNPTSCSWTSACPSSTASRPRADCSAPTVPPVCSC